MRASVLYDVARLELREVPRPTIGPFDVSVRVSAVGLCGTDFHIFSGDANYNYGPNGVPIPFIEQPQILGHEIVGVVDQLGREVKDLSEGNAVILDQGLNCSSARRTKFCEYCASGDSHQCEFYREHGITGLPGGLADYLSIPAVNAIRLHTNLDFSEAALTEPLSCIMRALDLISRVGARYAIHASDSARRVRSILICGAGPAGLLFTQYLRRIIKYDGLLLVSEPNEHKRALAHSFGAEVIDPVGDNLPELIYEKTNGRLVELLVEASGSGEVFRHMPGLIRKQATVLLYGYGYAGIEMSLLNNIHFKEPTIVVPVGASGGFDQDGRPTVYRQSLALLEEACISVASLITHRYSGLESVPQAFGGDHHQPDYVKGIVLL